MSERTYFKWLDAWNRVRVQLLVEKGEVRQFVVQFVVQYEALIDEKWRAIVRYDSTHGFAHRDVIHPSGDQDKYPLPFEDLGVAMTYGEQDIEDRWEWYRERYEREREQSEDKG